MDSSPLITSVDTTRGEALLRTRCDLVKVSGFTKGFDHGTIDGSRDVPQLPGDRSTGAEKLDRPWWGPIVPMLHCQCGSQVLVGPQTVAVATRLKESPGLVLFNEVRESLEPFDALQKSTDFANGSPAYLRGAPGTQVYEI